MTSSKTRGMSQLGQDFFVLEVLGGLRNGFFLDSGAADGLRSSNTWILESEFGWNGICVEPNDTFFAALRTNRRCHVVNCCLYDRDGPVEFLEDANLLGGIFDAYDAAVLKYITDHRRAAYDRSGNIRTVLKPARTVRSVLEECNAPAVIDYWSLDTEGSELAILKSFPFDEYSFRVLTVEHNHSPVREAIREFLEPRGYRRIRQLGVDDCYLRDSSPPVNLSWRSGAWRQARR